MVWSPAGTAIADTRKYPDMTMDKTYRPQEVERRIVDLWEASGAFGCGHTRTGGKTGESYSIVIPPPNVTGSLHMGHALNNTLQDILVRFERMRGRDVLWQPGTDHAGIATQMVVERQLAEQGIGLARGSAADNDDAGHVGRDEFVERVWAWKEESGGTITGQLRRLGASLDWSRERFTMDEGLSAAVLEVFVSLYREGLIYKDKRLVNWDPQFHTAISDLEVDQKEVQGNLWYISYPIENRPGESITVATTRPETMLGDTGIAVHPDNPRWKHLIGKSAVLPLVGRKIPIVADEYSDPEMGSGAVKITPAHDFNDFEVGARHGLDVINILTADAHLNDSVPEVYRGLERFEARKRVVEDLEAAELIEKIETHAHTVPHGDRSGVPIEPFLTEQWYVDAQTLAEPAIAAVEQGRTRFVPKQWERTYFHWMRNIEPWCISRQLWWGHRIPAWYGPDGEIFVALSEDEAMEAARAHYGEDVSLNRDPDVLDTWFSSALWPFSTLGWPDGTPELDHHYPTDVLVTGFDIIFFWVARMMMMGLHFMKDVPFHDVYIHALVRDEKGRKMSKSLGNVMDPLEMIDRYGADALRFTLTALAAQGRDVKLATGRLEGYRNFVTKLWNAARFTRMNGCAPVADFDPASCRLTVNRWIVGETVKVGAEIVTALEEYRFNEAAQSAYRFVWHRFCDWYLEFAKPVFQDGSAEDQMETRAATSWVLDQILHFLHPIMPFVTEELWAQLAPEAGRDGLLVSRPWPAPADSLRDQGAEEEMDWVVRMVGSVRAVRSEMNVPASAELEMTLVGASDRTKTRLEAHMASLVRLARLSKVSSAEALPEDVVQMVVDETTIGLPLGDVIDVAAETARLQRELKKTTAEIEKAQKKLANRDFVSRAPPEVVEEQRERAAESQQVHDRLAEALQRLAPLAGNSAPADPRPRA